MLAPALASALALVIPLVLLLLPPSSPPLSSPRLSPKSSLYICAPTSALLSAPCSLCHSPPASLEFTLLIRMVYLYLYPRILMVSYLYLYFLLPLSSLRLLPASPLPPPCYMHTLHFLGAWPAAGRTSTCHARLPMPASFAAGTAPCSGSGRPRHAAATLGCCSASCPHVLLRWHISPLTRAPLSCPSTDNAPHVLLHLSCLCTVASARLQHTTTTMTAWRTLWHRIKQVPVPMC